MGSRKNSVASISSRKSDAIVKRSEVFDRSDVGEKSELNGRAGEEEFYRQCRAAYLMVCKSTLEKITTRQQLCQVLQNAGRSPSRRALEQYFPVSMSALDFEDVCEVARQERPVAREELLAAFRKIDRNSDGFLTCDELRRVLTTRGERMTEKELQGVFEDADVNRDGKLDYAEFSRMVLETARQCERMALERLEADGRGRVWQLGSQAPERGISSRAGKSEASPRASPRVTPQPAMRAASRPSSSGRDRRPSVSSMVSVSAGKARGKLPEPKNLKDWKHIRSKGCFFVEEDGSLASHHYRLELTQPTSVYITVQPLDLSPEDGPRSTWFGVDTAVFILRENGDSANAKDLVSFTELCHKETFAWRGDLQKGSYLLLPFTTGCRLRKRSSTAATASRSTALITTAENGELELTRQFRTVLSDIFEIIDLDGNGLLSLEEYNLFELRTSGEECDTSAWEVCKANFDMKRNELTRQGFLDLTLMEARDQGGDPRDLWVTLEAMGYNRDLHLDEACPLVLDVFAEEVRPRLSALPVEALGWRLARAVCEATAGKGEARVLDASESVVVHVHRSESRITTVLQNKRDIKVVVRVDCSQSKNCVSSRGMDVFAVEVPPHTTVIGHHVMPMNERLDWVYNCTETLLT
uniref:EF-hand calcium-binding domain-containing protein 7 n=1 Tax=Petromyzon marinus TaxID=7757 RepID=A0AAJ7U0W1_PETMA|nr:EF-hand calcium-binding domain-containing protein 7 [Petromyzon marinus]XP_032826591.1 EF-hand calcium-binding domain-containing protein 7 [Petromyzon marinus]XP_032826592.1 EF-hand calcium-binding domain-containing protein 7 [Petromyzon marinus]